MKILERRIERLEHAREERRPVLVWVNEGDVYTVDDYELSRTQFESWAETVSKSILLAGWDGSKAENKGGTSLT